PAPQQVRGACQLPSQPASSRGVAVELRGSQSLVEELGSASEFEVEEGLHGEVVDDRAGLRRARGEGDLEPLLHIGDALAVAEIVLRGSDCRECMSSYFVDPESLCHRQCLLAEADSLARLAGEHARPRDIGENACCCRRGLASSQLRSACLMPE